MVEAGVGDEVGDVGEAKKAIYPTPPVRLEGEGEQFRIPLIGRSSVMLRSLLADSLGGWSMQILSDSDMTSDVVLISGPSTDVSGILWDLVLHFVLYGGNL